MDAQERLKEKMQREQVLKRKSMRKEWLELYLWVLLSLALGTRAYLAYVEKQFGVGGSLSSLEILNIILLYSLILIIPFLVKLIYGKYPIGLLRMTVLRTTLTITENTKTNTSENSDETEIRASFDELLYQDYDEYSIQLCVRSQKLANKILSRSSAYLFIGALIAITGVVYFSAQSSNFKATDSAALLVQVLPRIGALFFIEFIAFFFLKQYRVTMEDFKYYSSITRQRETNLLLKKILLDPKLKKDQELTDKMIANLDLSINPDVISKNDTSINLESKKYNDTELGVFNNIVDKLGTIRLSRNS